METQALSQIFPGVKYSVRGTNEVITIDKGAEGWTSGTTADGRTFTPDMLDTYQEGSVSNPFVLDIPEDAWVPTGDFHGDGSLPAHSRMSTKVCLSGLMMHVEAIEVKENEDETSPEFGYLQATNAELEEDVARIWAIAGWEGDRPNLLVINGREYLVTWYPFA